MIPEGNTFIWGAGKWGRLAYSYYHGTCNIVGYIDKNEKLSGMEIDGVPVYHPDILKSKKAVVIVAVKHGVNEIKRLLKEEYGIKEIAVFRMILSYEDTDVQKNQELPATGLIVKFKGGLGNQMFQYALYKIYQQQGKNVTADVSFYITLSSGSRAFSLLDVFKRTDIKYSPSTLLFHYEQCVDYGDMLVYQEPELPDTVFDQAVLDLNSGIVDGYFQSYKYPELVKEELMREFVFFTDKDKNLSELLHKMEQQECVAVHVRRGDYKGLESIFGSLWDEEYYEQALKKIKTQVMNPVFYFFSDDIVWTKEHFHEENAIYIESQLFSHYEDWYDMCLMSHCKHNIIANSTFSWWGAWLNQNPDKVVIAPKKWMKDDVMMDMCPLDWIRL